jgi:hypothetical protein
MMDNQAPKADRMALPRETSSLETYSSLSEKVEEGKVLPERKARSIALVV